MTPSELERAVRDLVVSGSGLARTHVIKGDANAPRRGEPYASVLQTNDVEQCHPMRRTIIVGDETINRESHQQRALFSVQFYRDGAMDRAVAFAAYAVSELGLLEAVRLGIRVVAPVTADQLNLPVADKIERRAIINLGIDYVRNITQRTGAMLNAAPTLTSDEEGS